MTQDNATTDTLLTNFATWLKGRGRSAHSLRAYRSDVSQFTTWFHQHTQDPFTLAAVTDQDIVDWLDHLSQVLNAMPATVNRKLAALSTFFRWAGEAKLVTSDPTANINGVEQQAVAPKALTEAAMNKILRKAREGGNPRDHALLCQHRNEMSANHRAKVSPDQHRKCPLRVAPPTS